MKTIDWNTMSDLGLIRRINREILHPLGLAIARDPNTGISDCILVADDGEWEYSDESLTKGWKSDSEIKQFVQEIIKG